MNYTVLHGVTNEVPYLYTYVQTSYVHLAVLQIQVDKTSMLVRTEIVKESLYIFSGQAISTFESKVFCTQPSIDLHFLSDDD